MAPHIARVPGPRKPLAMPAAGCHARPIMGRPRYETTGTAGRGRKPPLATADYLRDWALRYLERYSASAAHLRRLMAVKVKRSA